MSKQVVFILACLLAACLLVCTLIVAAAWFAIGANSTFVNSNKRHPASAVVFVEILPTSITNVEAPQDVDYAEVIKSDLVLLPIAERFASAFPDSTPEQVAQSIRDRLDVKEESEGLLRLQCKLAPCPLGHVILEEIVDTIPAKLNRALWPNASDILQEKGELRLSVETATQRLKSLETEYRQLQETTPLVSTEGGPPKLPQTLVDKKTELIAAREKYEALITELAEVTLKESLGLQYHVIEAVSEVRPTDREMATYEQLRRECSELPVYESVGR